MKQATRRDRQHGEDRPAELQQDRSVIGADAEKGRMAERHLPRRNRPSG